MEVKQEKMNIVGLKFYIEDEGIEVARTYLYILKNDLHEEPFGFMEDVFVEEEFRERGHGSELVRTVVAEAKEIGCYKLICTSRHSKPEVHEMYKKLGFKDQGLEFRIDF